jgi:hypothetical protein
MVTCVEIYLLKRLSDARENIKDNYKIIYIFGLRFFVR